MFTAIFVGLYLAAWLVLGFLPWLALSVATRGRAGLINLPLCLFAAVVAGLAVPLLGATGGTGLLASMAAAFLVPLALLAARHWAVAGLRRPTPAPERAPR